MENIKRVLDDFLKSNYPDVNIKIEIRENKDKKKGAYYTTLGFYLMTYINQSPYDIGIFIKNEIKEKLKEYYDIEVSPRGYINFFLGKEGYRRSFREIKNIELSKIPMEFIFIDKCHLKKIQYLYERVDNILEILKLEGIYSDFQNFDKEHLEFVEKQILDEILNVFKALKKYGINKKSIQSMFFLCDLFDVYEEKVIIKYLPKKRLENLAIIMKSIVDLAEKILHKLEISGYLELK